MPQTKMTNIIFFNLIKKDSAAMFLSGIDDYSAYIAAA